MFLTKEDSLRARVAHVVKCLPSKYEALSSTPVQPLFPKKKKKKKEDSLEIPRCLYFYASTFLL
jgi:hypothetical protein